MAFEKIVVNVGFKLLGRALVSCSKIEQAVKDELEFYESRLDGNRARGEPPSRTNRATRALGIEPLPRTKRATDALN